MIKENYDVATDTPSLDSITAEIAKEAKQASVECFSPMFKKYDESEILEVFRESAKINLKNKDEIYRYYANSIEADVIENVGIQVTCKSVDRLRHTSKKTKHNKK